MFLVLSLYYYFILIGLLFWLPVCFLKRERKKVQSWVDGGGDGEGLEELGEDKE